jgi:hypothetical protein
MQEAKMEWRRRSTAGWKEAQLDAPEASAAAVAWAVALCCSTRAPASRKEDGRPAGSSSAAGGGWREAQAAQGGAGGSSPLAEARASTASSASRVLEGVIMAPGVEDPCGERRRVGEADRRRLSSRGHQDWDCS